MLEMSLNDNLDSYLLLPCREDGGGGGKRQKGKDGLFNHSVTGCFEVENKPLRINTIYFIGSPSKLKTHLKRKEGVELEEGKNSDENFVGASGLTFPCQRADGSSFVMIWMPKFEWTVLDLETLCHECLHAAVMAMKMSGVRSKIFTAEKEEEVDDEGLCYRQATMLTNLLKKMIGKQNRMFKKSLEEVKSQSSAPSKDDDLKRCVKPSYKNRGKSKSRKSQSCMKV